MALTDFLSKFGNVKWLINHLVSFHVTQQIAIQMKSRSTFSSNIYVSTKMLIHIIGRPFST